MSNTASKTGSRKTTIVLSAILVLLVLFAVIVFWGIPAYRHYYITHIRYPVYGGLTAELKDSEFYEDMRSGKSFCFLGDSITAGNEIEGITWYYPLIPYIKGDIYNVSRGGWRVGNLILEEDKIPVCDIYVTAIGVNDILFNYLGLSPEMPSDYTTGLDKLVNIIRSKSPNAKFYFIAPWTVHNQDDTANSRADEFRTALINLCDEKGYICINPDPVLSSVLKNTGIKDYMKDNFHPNASNGVGLYSYAVLKADHDRKAALQK